MVETILKQFTEKPVELAIFENNNNKHLFKS